MSVGLNEKTPHEISYVEHSRSPGAVPALCSRCHVLGRGNPQASATEGTFLTRFPGRNHTKSRASVRGSWPPAHQPPTASRGLLGHTDHQFQLGEGGWGAGSPCRVTRQHVNVDGVQECSCCFAANNQQFKYPSTTCNQEELFLSASHQEETV